MSGTIVQTNAIGGTLKFTFSSELTGDTFKLIDAQGNEVASSPSLSSDSKSVSFNVTGLSAGPNPYTLTVTTTAGFEADTSVVFNVIAPPTNTINHSDVQVSASSAGITVSSNVAATFIVQDDDATNPVQLTLDTDPTTVDGDGYLAVTRGGSITLIPAPQSTQAWVGTHLWHMDKKWTIRNGARKSCV